MWRNDTLIHCHWQYKLIQTFWKTMLLKIQIIYELVTPFLDFYTENYIWYNKICTRIFISALFRRAPNWKQSKGTSTGERQINFVFSCNGILQNNFKNELLMQTTVCMNFTDIILSQWSMVNWYTTLSIGSSKMSKNNWW